MKKMQIGIGACAAFGVCCGAAVFFLLMGARPAATSSAPPVELTVATGASVRAVAEQLERAGVIRSAAVFYLAARFPPIRLLVTGRTSGIALKSGTYTVHAAMNYNELFALLSSGRADTVRVVIPEGYTVSMTAQRLEEQGICSARAFIQAAHDAALLTHYGIAAGSFEGYLFPDTYFFVRSMSAETVVRTMVDTFFRRIADIPELIGMTPDELNDIVILASIVEREYRAPDEAPLIASVFQNRIRGNIGLYSCATIVYIITEIEGKPHPDLIRHEDLLIDNPYNTYRWAGLPPGAISNPGIIALRAAASPPKTAYYYFRLVDPDAGRHVFTETFDDHRNEGNRLYTKRVR
ncbi:MAG: endolytic transglycosylase MltG [Treponema sp.]|nr:endolytic transglycosylase MltG [Treponema sp.]